MALRTDIDLKGFQEIERRLKGLGKAASVKVVRNLHTSAGRSLARDVKKVLPRKGQGKGFARGELRKAVNYRPLGATIGYLRVKKPAGAHWHLYEYGTVNQAATFATTQAVDGGLGKAFNVGRKKAIETLDRELAKLGVR